MMYYVVYETISLFGKSNDHNVAAFETLGEARDFAQEVTGQGSPNVTITQEIGMGDEEERLAN
ncbi:hypothetical protein [Aneurinibacillus aneurinilyticus]|jgi:hypothetical protein|uniref:Uncharacterized protein n=2 Tax=Aneurinibacillus aneurinilyticus TaxID=1391 RepID=A0A848CTB0_ANEAE|nr:hypothetical protein [Aneurinibacillus aneurinilyticus]ERI09359.1 hypothetical protein HMPREF0083_02638 [Aneurinibacillus aneurinilyticus ATCC 12856]MCI1694646.1 hypothetical protein [Aneurinibacillus aneurinilyticus]MED0672172.1 hypothetical protein [Aneurinibacillus aneurinilyticus]MED0704719.1 hypothetical protein [Aneurinibacillus aneurinilyticus]MED0723963.1 hypothetical protein [Aneurinibacillus aneurinilyticus]